MEIKVKNINGTFHARLLEGTTILDEMICELKSDIGYICREMLRWQDKMGNSTPWTSSARKRQITKPSGKVKYIRN